MGCLFFQVHADSSLVIKSDIMGCLLRRSVYPSRQGEAQGRETALSGQGMFHGHPVPAQGDSLGDAAGR